MSYCQMKNRKLEILLSPISQPTAKASKGRGTLATNFGSLKFRPWKYTCYQHQLYGKHVFSRMIVGSSCERYFWASEKYDSQNAITGGDCFETIQSQQQIIIGVSSICCVDGLEFQSTIIIVGQPDVKNVCLFPGGMIHSIHFYITESSETRSGSTFPGLRRLWSLTKSLKAEYIIMLSAVWPRLDMKYDPWETIVVFLLLCFPISRV